MERRIEYLVSAKYPVIVRAIRKELNLSVNQLASWLNLSTSTALIERETGTLKLTREYYEKIKEVLEKKTGKDIEKLEKKYINKINPDLVNAFYWRIFQKGEWKDKLDFLLKIYSESQLSVLLDVHSQRNIEVIKKSKTINPLVKARMEAIYHKIKAGKDPRVIYFNSWRARQLKNRYGILTRELRNRLGITGSHLAEELKIGTGCIIQREIGIVPMEYSFYSRIKKVFEERCNNLDRLEKGILEKINKSKLLPLREIERFNPEECSCVTKIIPKSSVGRSAEKIIYDKLRNKWRVYWGVRLLPKNLKQNEKEIDILLFLKNKRVAIDVKKEITKKTLYYSISRLSNKFRNLKKSLNEIDEFVVLLTQNTLNRAQKRKFEGNNIRVFDKTNIQDFLENPSIVTRKQVCNKKDIKEKIRSWRLSPRQLIVLLEDIGYKFSAKSFYGKLGYLYRLYFAPKTVMERMGRNPDSYIDFEVDEFIAKLEKRINKFGLFKMHQKANLLLADLGHKKLIRDREEWKKLKLFSCVVDLKSKKDGFENHVANIFRKRGHIVIQNAGIGSRNLKELESYKTCPEVDIVVKLPKSKEALVACKDQRNRGLRDAVQDIKREVEKMSVITENMKCEKLIFTTLKATSKVRNSLKKYASKHGISINFINYRNPGRGSSEDSLRGKLTKDELELLPGSYDIIGNIIVLELNPKLYKKERLIARALIKLHPHIKTVCKKLGPRKGRLRLRGLKVILGKETETLHKEHGCLFKLDVKKAYFSPREATERMRVAGQVKPGERVLVMFSGIGPFGIVAAKVQPECRVVGVELNSDAVKYADESVKLNRMRYQVENIQGDVRKVCPGLGKFDRIIMPLPEEAWKYLDTVFQCSKKGTVVHLYGFSGEEKLYKNLEQELAKAAKKAKKKVKVTGRRKVLPYGTRIWKVCLEFKVVG